MAKGDEIEAVFLILEKVFDPAQEYEYDEGLEELGLHTAKVRKTYPNLFKALQFPSRVTKQEPGVIDGQQAKELVDAIRALGQNGHAVKQPATLPMYTPPTAQPGELPMPIEQAEETEPSIKYLPYSEWANSPLVKNAQLGQEFAYRWDIASVPPKQVTETFALKNRDDGGRTRFHVIGLLDDMVYQVKVVKILPGMDG